MNYLIKLTIFIITVDFIYSNNDHNLTL